MGTYLKEIFIKDGDIFQKEIYEKTETGLIEKLIKNKGALKIMICHL